MAKMNLLILLMFFMSLHLSRQTDLIHQFPASSIKAKQFPLVIAKHTPHKANHGITHNQYHHPETVKPTNTMLPINIPTLLTKLDVKSHIIIKGIKHNPVI